MNILIIDDNMEFRELLACLVKNERPDANVIEAGCLFEAKALIKRVDAVLCDGAFATYPERSDSYTVRETNWATVRRECERARKPFVLISGNLELVNRLRMVGTPAFPKPNGVLEAVRKVVSVPNFNDDLRRPVADLRIEIADEENSRIEDKDTQVEGRAWWKSFRR